MTPASYREWVEDGDRPPTHHHQTGLEAWSARAERHIATLEDRALKAESRAAELRIALDRIEAAAHTALEDDR